jgi:hypothetical protein
VILVVADGFGEATIDTVAIAALMTSPDQDHGR